MLFMGSEKYPIENDFKQFINEAGGIYNAYTSKHRTCYYFDVSHDNLKSAIDRSGDFCVRSILHYNNRKKGIRTDNNKYYCA